MLMRTDPFRDLDRLTQQVFGTVARPAAMPMDAFRKADTFYIKLDLPGTHPRRDRPDRGAERADRPRRTPARPETATSNCSSPSARPGPSPGRYSSATPSTPTTSTADYTAGVLTLAIPVHEAAKPRKVAITSHDAKQIKST